MHSKFPVPCLSNSPSALVCFRVVVLTASSVPLQANSMPPPASDSDYNFELEESATGHCYYQETALDLHYFHNINVI